MCCPQTTSHLNHALFGNSAATPACRQSQHQRGYIQLAEHLLRTPTSAWLQAIEGSRAGLCWQSLSLCDAHLTSYCSQSFAVVVMGRRTCRLSSQRPSQGGGILRALRRLSRNSLILLAVKGVVADGYVDHCPQQVP
jgi:hypothetical protein